MRHHQLLFSLVGQSLEESDPPSLKGWHLALAVLLLTGRLMRLWGLVPSSTRLWHLKLQQPPLPPQWAMPWAPTHAVFTRKLFRIALTILGATSASANFIWIC